MGADASMSLSVVVERRDIENPWQDYVWRPIAVIPNAARGERWRELQSGADWVHFLAGTFDLELFRGETEGYMTNLSQNPPQIYVVLRQGEEAEDNDVEPFHVTACPFEAMGYHESGDEIVEGVPMPEDMMSWLQDFVDQYHVETPFEKRKNKGHKDKMTGSRPRGQLGRT